ncbi:hypothetical protein DFA_10454 [Cavenderia fasciculata]|uniref:Uncharacterized protein n=1 Tax=Cavenderia fasciculata TaxID=261658 RepID=F4QA93_CACFS|nr:uncharacterized protein DFA_10454 [Cavenderia fasciculata]EGG15612.1 hypothetical protein DFA_10454 [Cavenderia fasciculata]|eukprot:XP_004354354.1 hypothetical protein DFA_10454 [Cavenderia fasciculata]
MIFSKHSLFILVYSPNYTIKESMVNSNVSYSLRQCHNHLSSQMEEQQIITVLSRVIEAGNYQFVAKIMMESPLSIEFKQFRPFAREEISEAIFKVYFQLRSKEKEEKDCKQLADLFLNIIPKEHQSPIIYYSSSLDDVEFYELWYGLFGDWNPYWLYQTHTREFLISSNQCN